jgi:malate synthase
VRLNVKVGIQYVEAWLRGNGCVPLYNLMEDAATAEISRTQIWQWLKHQSTLADGRPFTDALYNQWVQEELIAIRKEIGAERYDTGQFERASQLFIQMSKADPFVDFLTLPAYSFI